MKIHGYSFDFIDEEALREPAHLVSMPTIRVRECRDRTLTEAFTLSKPWVPLSGREGRYFSKTPFETADADFSWGLEIREVLTLLWEPETQTIHYIKDARYTPQRLQFWIYHTFFPIALELNQVCHFLHVGAVETGGKTFFFSAPSFGGKSTLTDYFIQKGATLISDDALGIEAKGGRYLAIPAYPFHRPYRDPETLGYAVKKFAQEPKNINAVFILEKADKDAKVRIEALKGLEKFKALHYAVFIDFPFRKKERFAFFSQMAQRVPLYSITIPWDLKRLEEVHKAIVGLALPNAIGK